MADFYINKQQALSQNLINYSNGGVALDDIAILSSKDVETIIDNRDYTDLNATAPLNYDVQTKTLTINLSGVPSSSNPTFTGTLTFFNANGNSLFTSNFIMNNGATNNYILTTDVNGVGTWQENKAVTNLSFLNGILSFKENGINKAASLNSYNDTRYLRLIGGSLTGSFAIGTLTPDPNVLFTVSSTDKASIPAPVMTQTQILAIPSPIEGMQVYNSTLHQMCFYNGTEWRKVTDSAM